MLTYITKKMYFGGKDAYLNDGTMGHPQAATEWEKFHTVYFKSTCSCWALHPPAHTLPPLKIRKFQTTSREAYEEYPRAEIPRLIAWVLHLGFHTRSQTASC